MPVAESEVLHMQRLVEAAPAAMHKSLKGPLQQALQGVQQDADRPRTCAAAEVLSGVLASSATYERVGKPRMQC
jgi:hypothetical protein